MSTRAGRVRAATREAPSSVDRLLLGLLRSGARAAAYELSAATLTDSEGVARTVLVDHVLQDDDVVARVVGREASGTRFDEVHPLWDAARVVQGMQLERIERPDPDLLFWQTATLVEARVETRIWATAPQGFLVPATSSRPGLLIGVSAADRRGMGGVVWTDDERGRRFVRRLITNVPEARGRMAALRSSLSEEAFTSVLAMAISEYLQRPDAMAGTDDAPPALSWDVSARDAAGAIRGLAGWPRASVSRHPYRRWGGLFEAVVAEGNEELTGRRSASPAGRRTEVALDAPLDPAVESGETVLDRLPAPDDPTSRIEHAESYVERVELDELLAGRALTTREQEVLHLAVVEDLTPAMIAARLGIAEATARVTLHHIRRKLRRGHGSDVNERAGRAPFEGI